MTAKIILHFDHPASKYQKHRTLLTSKDFPGGQGVKHLPAMQETWVRSPGHEDPLEKETATHSNTPAWKIPWAEEPGRL